jgi:hypothetical protein
VARRAGWQGHPRAAGQGFVAEEAGH